MHQPTGKYYVGKGITENVKSGKYKGSGVRLHKAFKKYPKSQWDTAILWEFDTSDEAYSDEGGIVTQEMLDDPLCLNLALGGNGPTPTAWPEERKQAASEKYAGTGWGKPPEKGKKRGSYNQGAKSRGARTDEQKAAMHVPHPNQPKKQTPEAIAARTYKVTCPHCTKIGSVSNMKRYHFDNCRSTGL